MVIPSGLWTTWLSFVRSSRHRRREKSPLPGVAVVLKGTTMGTSTDIDGKYTLTLPEGNYTLVFSMLGMSVREELVGDRTEINVVMHEEATEIDEVVVTGIFKKARESYTGAVSTIDGEDLQMFRGQNLVQTLKNMDITFFSLIMVILFHLLISVVYMVHWSVSNIFY